MTTKRKRKDALTILTDMDGELTFSKLLKSIREGEELSQTELGKIIGLSKQKVCDIEKGRWLPSPALAARYAEKLGYSPEHFVQLVLQEEIRQSGLKLRVEVVA